MAENNESVVWNVDMEVSLFHAMRGHKPVGVNRHFQMVYIHNKLNEFFPKKISADQIWKQLSTLYQLQALNESEILPFPNKETDFSLPEIEYNDLLKKDFPRTPHLESSTDIKESIRESHKEQKDSKEHKSDKLERSDSHGKSSKSSNSSRPEVKGSPVVHSGKEGKGSHTPQSKHDSKSHSTPHSSKDKHKDHSSSKRKRTRQANSAAASPATPNDTPPVKRRR